MIDWQEFPCNGMTLLMARAGAAATRGGTGTRPLLWPCTRILIRIGVKVFIPVRGSAFSVQVFLVSRAIPPTRQRSLPFADSRSKTGRISNILRCPDTVPTWAGGYSSRLSIPRRGSHGLSSLSVWICSGSGRGIGQSLR